MECPGPHEIGLFEAIYSLRAIRYFKPDPVPDDVLAEVLRAATQAASGGNRQPWQFLVIDDLAIRTQLGEMVRELRGTRRPSYALMPDPDPEEVARSRGTTYLVQHWEDAPVLILACAIRWLDPEVPTADAIAYGSIFPAVQNLMLAARAFGLGTTLTTFNRWDEPRVKALLSIPDYVDTICLIPMGYAARPFGPVSRKPVDEVTFRNRWGKPLR